LHRDSWVAMYPFGGWVWTLLQFTSAATFLFTVSLDQPHSNRCCPQQLGSPLALVCRAAALAPASSAWAQSLLHCDGRVPQAVHTVSRRRGPELTGGAVSLGNIAPVRKVCADNCACHLLRAVRCAMRANVQPAAPRHASKELHSPQCCCTSPQCGRLSTMTAVCSTTTTNTKTNAKALSLLWCATWAGMLRISFG
jgi:hypothetical protein